MNINFVNGKIKAFCKLTVQYAVKMYIFNYSNMINVSESCLVLVFSRCTLAFHYYLNLKVIIINYFNYLLMQVGIRYLI